MQRVEAREFSDVGLHSSCLVYVVLSNRQTNRIHEVTCGIHTHAMLQAAGKHGVELPAKTVSGLRLRG
jgi:hypothetical protein